MGVGGRNSVGGVVWGGVDNRGNRGRDIGRGKKSEWGEGFGG